jgi:hypothetical protein
LSHVFRRLRLLTLSNCVLKHAKKLFERDARSFVDQIEFRQKIEDFAIAHRYAQTFAHEIRKASHREFAILIIVEFSPMRSDVERQSE